MEGGGRTGQKDTRATKAETMKAGTKEKTKHIVRYIVYTFMEAVLLLFRILRNGFKERR